MSTADEFLDLVESLKIARDTIFRAHLLVYKHVGECKESKDLKFSLFQIDLALKRFSEGGNTGPNYH